MKNTGNEKESQCAMLKKLELPYEAFKTLKTYCEQNGIIFLSTPFDHASADFLNELKVSAFKIASGDITNLPFLAFIASKEKPVILSTGMSTMKEIDHAVAVLGKDDLVILHCTSTYPAKISEINLKVIPWLIARYDIPVGYSGHEVGVMPSVLSVAMGACMVERHITMDRAMWGSDQAASLETNGLRILVRDIRSAPLCMGDGKKVIYQSEIPVMEKLRWAHMR